MAVFSSRIAFGLIMSIVCLSFDSSHIFAVSLATSSVLISENMKILSTFDILSIASLIKASLFDFVSADSNTSPNFEYLLSESVMMLKGCWTLSSLK